MGIRSFYASVISPLLRSTKLGSRIDIALVAFRANLEFAGRFIPRMKKIIFSLMQNWTNYLPVWMRNL